MRTESILCLCLLVVVAQAVHSGKNRQPGNYKLYAFGKRALTCTPYSRCNTNSDCGSGCSCKQIWNSMLCTAYGNYPYAYGHYSRDEYNNKRKNSRQMKKEELSIDNEIEDWEFKM